MAGNILGFTDFTGLRLGDSDGTTRSVLSWMGYASSSLSTMAVLGNQTSTQTFGFSGVTPGDLVVCTMLSALSNAVGVANAYVSSAGVVSVAFSNASSTTQTIGVNTVYLAGFRMSNRTNW